MTKLVMLIVHYITLYFSNVDDSCLVHFELNSSYGDDFL